MNYFKKQVISAVLCCLFVSIMTAQSGSFTDPRDDQVYSTISIGDQTWMAENLRFKIENSVELRVKKNKYQTILDGSFKGAKECGTTDEYGGKAIMCEHLAKVGRYYLWEEANIACPDGWHLASSKDWQQLFDHVTEVKGPFKNKTPMSQSKDYFVGVGKVLKSAYWPNETDLTDELGFGIMPDGYAKRDKISIIGQVAQFWTSTPLIYKNGNQARGYYKYIELNQFNENVYREDGLDSYGRSVRCVKD